MIDRYGRANTLSKFRLTEVHFYSLSSLNAARKTHPAAALPSLQVPHAGNGLITQVRMDQLSISGDHVVLGLGLPHGPPGVHSIAVCNWKTGRVTKVRLTLPLLLESLRVNPFEWMI